MSLKRSLVQKKSVANRRPPNKTSDFKSFLAITEEFPSFLTESSRNPDEGIHMVSTHVS
jgi:hypothetical protein